MGSINKLTAVTFVLCFIVINCEVNADKKVYPDRVPQGPRYGPYGRLQPRHLVKRDLEDFQDDYGGYYGYQAYYEPETNYVSRPRRIKILPAFLPG